MERNAHLDNAKYFLIFLVVFGHAIEPLIKGQDVLKIIYLFIYSFHMPAFALISGMLSKAELKAEYIQKIITSIFIPFLVFTLLYEVFHFIDKGSWSNYVTNLRPYWILWFLYSLILWKIFLPIILNFKYPLTISILLALGAGYLESIGYFLGLSRTVYFFPFFIMGYKLTPSAFSAMKNKFNSKLGLAILIGTLLANIVLFVVMSDMKHQWLWGSFYYSRLGAEGITASGTRLALYILATITLGAFLLLITANSHWLLKGGENSLYVYVWHGFIIKIMGSLGIIYAIGELPVIASLFMLLATSIVLTKLLSTDFVAVNTRRFILKPVEKLFIKNEYK